MSEAKASDVPAHGAALFTDLYELTMLRAYHDLGMADEAVFSLYVRTLPPQRNFLIACGQSEFIDILEALRFSEDDLAYIGSLGRFPPAFIEWLRGFRFTGEVHAVAEGTPVFPNEPILEVVAPIGQAQLVETLALNIVGTQTMLASKGLRYVTAARGRPIVDFGSRRAHGMDSAVRGARAFYIAGVASTSNVLAGRRYGIPVTGTVAHSFIEACENEAEAFAAFASVFPETTLLVDTYDTLKGVEKVVALARRLGSAFAVQAIRLDSGDLAALSKRSRQILDAAGLTHVRIFASGGLEEAIIDDLLRKGAPIDAFGVGTDMSVSGDAPSLDIAYKLTEYAGRGRMKLSSGKRSLPGRKQVFREIRDGVAIRDVIARAGEALEGVPLLRPVMRGGRRLEPPVPLEDIRAHARQALATLPEALRGLAPPPSPYEVRVSEALRALEQEVETRIAAQAGG